MKVKSLQERYLSLFLNRSGSVLIAAVWMLVLFSILSAGLYRMVSTCLNISTRFEYGVICRSLARSATVLDQALEGKDDTAYDTIYELSQKQSRKIGNLSFEYTSEDESGKLNINTAPVVQMAGLPGFDEDLAEKIAGSDLRPFAATEELLDVEGMTAEIYGGLNGFITVHTDGAVNINTAPKEVFAALGYDRALIEDIINFREGDDGQEGTKDDGVFESVSEIVPEMKAQGLSPGQEVTLSNSINSGALRTDSVCRTLRILTGVSGKKANSYAVILEPSRIKQWKEL